MANGWGAPGLSHVACKVIQLWFYMLKPHACKHCSPQAGLVSHMFNANALMYIVIRNFFIEYGPL